MTYKQGKKLIKKYYVHLEMLMSPNDHHIYMYNMKETEQYFEGRYVINWVQSHRGLHLGNTIKVYKFNVAYIEKIKIYTPYEIELCDE